jgi:hypothetical protein
MTITGELGGVPWCHTTLQSAEVSSGAIVTLYSLLDCLNLVRDLHI